MFVLLPFRLPGIRFLRCRLDGLMTLTTRCIDLGLDLAPLFDFFLIGRPFLLFLFDVRGTLRLIGIAPHLTQQTRDVGVAHIGILFFDHRPAFLRILEERRHGTLRCQRVLLRTSFRDYPRAFVLGFFADKACLNKNETCSTLADRQYNDFKGERLQHFRAHAQERLPDLVVSRLFVPVRAIAIAQMTPFLGNEFQNIFVLLFRVGATRRRPIAADFALELRPLRIRKAHERRSRCLRRTRNLLFAAAASVFAGSRDTDLFDGIRQRRPVDSFAADGAVVVDSVPVVVGLMQ